MHDDPEKVETNTGLLAGYKNWFGCLLYFDTQLTRLAASLLDEQDSTLGEDKEIYCFCRKLSYGEVRSMRLFAVASNVTASVLSRQKNIGTVAVKVFSFIWLKRSRALRDTPSGLANPRNTTVQLRLSRGSILLAFVAL